MLSLKFHKLKRFHMLDTLLVWQCLTFVEIVLYKCGTKYYAPILLNTCVKDDFCLQLHADIYRKFLTKCYTGCYRRDMIKSKCSLSPGLLEVLVSVTKYLGLWFDLTNRKKNKATLYLDKLFDCSCFNLLWYIELDKTVSNLNIGDNILQKRSWVF